MREEAAKLAVIIRARKKVRVVTHIDADGICAGAIASLALDRAGIENDVRFVKQLDPESIRTAREGHDGLLWFTDLGSGSLDMLSGLDCIITDHHVPNGKVSVPSVNPHLSGMSGAQDASGAGAAYFVARELDAGNTDLAALAIVGAVGDLQDSRDCRLTGANREILEDGKKSGVLDWFVDIRYFGRETRPVHKLLQYASDPSIPGVTGSEQGALSFLQELGVPLKEGENWRSWYQLEHEEKRKIASAIVILLIERGYGHKMARRVLGEVHILTREREGTELHGCKEFATLLNSCGRHDKMELGLRVCRGDRGTDLKRAMGLLQDHRRTLVEGIQLVKGLGISKRSHLQTFHARELIEDTIVGVIAGMLLGSGEAGADPNLPVIAFATAGDGKGVKVSARAARALVERGLDLSAVMRGATAAVGGSGGGHNVAAGGLIPCGTEERFLDEAEKIIRGQLSPK
jgi:single-stranded-DNA-specific exonuclease